MVSVWQRGMHQICDVPLVLRYLGAPDRMGTDAVAYWCTKSVDGKILIY